MKYRSINYKDGLEKAVKVATKGKDKVNVIVYVNDFIITGSIKEVLENKGESMIVNFLGVSSQKYCNDKFIQKSAESRVKSFLNNIREMIKQNNTVKTKNLIHFLNPRIIG